MSTILILTPIIVGSWPAITAAVGSAAAVMGLAMKDSAANKVGVAVEEGNSVEVELDDSQAVGASLAADKEIVLTRGTMTLRIRHNNEGRCVICAEGKGHSKAELETVAQEFAQKTSQCFIYNKVMTELRAKGFQVVDEEQMEDEAVRIHVRRWED